VIEAWKGIQACSCGQQSPCCTVKLRAAPHCAASRLRYNLHGMAGEFCVIFCVNESTLDLVDAILSSSMLAQAGMLLLPPFQVVHSCALVKEPSSNFPFEEAILKPPNLHVYSCSS
jgi:hypothetical protein